MSYEGPTQTDLEPDLDMIRRHLHWNFANIFYGNIQIGVRNPKTRGINIFKTFDIDDLEKAASFAAEANSVPGQSVYFRPASVNDRGNESAVDEDFKLAPGLWVDCDTQESAANIKTKTAECSYNGYTITGRHPHARVQAFWRMASALDDGEEVRKLNKVLCNLVGGDGSVRNPTTLMRLGGSIAWPYADGRIVEMTSFHIKPEEEAASSIQKPILMQKLLAPLMPASNDDATLQLAGERFDLQACLKAISEGTERHDNVVRAAMHMVALNYDDTIIYDLIKAKAEIHFDWSDELERELNAAISSARAKIDPEDLVGSKILDAPANVVTPLAAAAYQLQGGANIPPREWIYGRHLIRSFLSCTVAPGGVGKSANSITELLSCCAGVDLFRQREELRRQYRVLYINLEDPYAELQRRIEAACAHFALTQDDIGDRLHIISGRDQEVVVAKEIEGKATIVTPIVDSLKALMVERQIDVLCLDPFVHSHALSENDNMEIAFVAGIFKGIADECNAAIELIHHTRKLNGQEASAEDARGAKGLVDAARSVRAIGRVPKETVERHGIKEDHRRFIFFGDGKANLAPPPDNNTWRRLASVDLDNATDEYPNGDSIGVMEAFSPPDPFDGVTVFALRQVQTAIMRGDERVRKSDQSKEWIGYLVAECCDLPCNDKPEKSRIKKIIATWEQNGALVEVKVKNKARQEVNGYEVGDYAHAE